MQRHFMRWVVLLALLGSSVARAANYFEWGVETPANNAITIGDPCNTGNAAYGTKQSWISPWKGTTVQDCTVAHSGSCSMKMVIQGDDTGNQQQGPDSCNPIDYPFNIMGAPGLYFRWWMKIQPGFSWGVSDGKAKSSRSVVPGGELYTAYLHGGGFRISECQNAASNCNSPGGTINNDYQGIDYPVSSMNDGAWHEYIVFIRPSSASGVADALFRAWVDGAEVQHSPWCSDSSTHCSTGTTGFRLDPNTQQPWQLSWGGGWMARPYFQMNGTPSDGGTIYIDDVSTDNTFNSIFSGGDTTPPTGVAVTVPSNGATVSGASTTVTATCTDETAVQDVQMLLDGSNLGSPDTSSPYSITWNTTGTGNGSHTLSARCTDTSSNQTTSSTISVTVSNDTTAPTDPANLWLTIAGATQLDLSWTASTDAVGVTGYRIERCTNAACSSFAEIAQTSGTTYSDTSGITAGTFYGYRVRASDAASNLSGYSNSAYAPPSALTHTATTTWSGLVNAIIDGHSFTTATGSCLVMQNASQANVIVRNSTFANCFDNAVQVTEGHDITFEDNTFSNSQRWLYIQITTGNVVVQRNSMSNQNQAVDGTKGGIQFNGVSGAGNRISYNDITNTNPEGTEDNISVFNSDGVSGSPITVEKNCITGVTTNNSGSGIAVGDGGGSYQLVQDNFVKDAGAGGIGIASGTNISALRNYIWQTGRPSVNGGLVIKNFYQGTETCDTILADANQVDYRNSSGTKVDGITGTIWWPVDGCTNVTVTGTNNGMATLSGDICAVVRGAAPVNTICVACAINRRRR